MYLRRRYTRPPSGFRYQLLSQIMAARVACCSRSSFAIPGPSHATSLGRLSCYLRPFGNRSRPENREAPIQPAPRASAPVYARRQHAVMINCASCIPGTVSPHRCELAQMTWKPTMIWRLTMAWKFMMTPPDLIAFPRRLITIIAAWEWSPPEVGEGGRQGALFCGFSSMRSIPFLSYRGNPALRVVPASVLSPSAVARNGFWAWLTRRMACRH